MVPLILLSVVGWAMGAERIWRLFRLPKEDKVREYAQRVYSYIERKEWAKAAEECDLFDHPLGRLFKSGLDARTFSPRDQRYHLERAANREIQHLERNFGGLLTIVGVSPMIGFLGTIVGLIKAFMSWEKMADNVTVSVLAAGIYQAMITTGAGLSVAIPLYIIYQMLVSRVIRLEHLMSDEGEEFLMRISK